MNCSEYNVKSTSTVLVGIVSYNSAQDICSCIESVLAQSFPNFSLVILDNNSNDTTIATLKEQFPHISIICESENLGFGKAHNRLIEIARQKNIPYYLCLNPDVVLDSNFVNEAISFLEANPNYSAVNGLICYLTEGQKSETIYSLGHQLFQDRRFEDWMIGQPKEKAPQEVTPIFGVNGACPVYRISSLDQLSPAGFDPHFFLYEEDNELGWRMELNKLPAAYVPSMLAWHVSGASGAIFSTRARKDAIANRWLNIIRNDHPLLFLKDLPWIILVEFLYLAGYSLKSPQIIWHYICAWMKVFRLAPHFLKTRSSSLLNLKERQQKIQPTNLTRLKSLLFRRVGNQRIHSIQEAQK